MRQLCHIDVEQGSRKMYHIKKDKRSRRSADAIADAFEKLLSEKPLLDISISDITRTAGVGRSTFYRLFDNIDDLVDFTAGRSISELAAKYEELPARDFVRFTLELIIRKGDTLIGVLTTGQAFLIARALRRAMKEYINRSIGNEKAAEYRASAFSGICISVLIAWHERGQKETIEELTDMIMQFLNMDALIVNLNKG